MTVHGAKGLEAPIVILADAATGPLSKGKPLYIAQHSDGPTLIHASAEKDRFGVSNSLYESDKDNQKSEYWRKLYVAMTRAEDELYLTGMLTKKARLEGTWYEAVEEALKDDCTLLDTGEDEDGLIFPAHRPDPAPISKRAEKAKDQLVGFAPEPLKPAQIQEIIRPSASYESDEQIFETSAEALVDSRLARNKGIALHALLQHLGTITPENREVIAMKALRVLTGGQDEWHEELAEKAISILSNPSNRDLFGPNSRAEVPFLVNAQRQGKVVQIAGRIDRMIADSENILVVDFKSDLNPASRPGDISPAYQNQMALYWFAARKMFVKHKVSAAIFWTTNETMMELPEKMLLKALELSNISDI